MAFIDKIGGIVGQDLLLACLQYVAHTCLCTIAEKRVKFITTDVKITRKAFLPI